MCFVQPVFLQNPGPAAQNNITHNVLEPSTNHYLRKCPCIQLAYNTILWRYFLNCGSFLSDDFLMSSTHDTIQQKDTKETRSQVTTIVSCQIQHTTNANFKLQDFLTYLLFCHFINNKVFSKTQYGDIKKTLVCCDLQLGKHGSDCLALAEILLLQQLDELS